MLSELALAVMAWRKAKQVKRAEQSAMRVEATAGPPGASQVVRLTAEMRWEKRHGGDLPGPWFDAWLEV